MVHCSGVYGRTPSVSPDTTVRNPREGEHIDSGRTGPQEDPRAFGHGGACCKHIIDQDNRPPPDVFHQPGADMESAPYITLAPGPAMAALGRRAAVADQQVRENGQASHAVVTGSA